MSQNPNLIQLCGCGAPQEATMPNRLRRANQARAAESTPTSPAPAKPKKAAAAKPKAKPVAKKAAKRRGR